MNVSEELESIENTLRDFISLQLSTNFGLDWIEKCGVSVDRLKTWKDRQEVERKQQKSGSADTRIIYYSDFYDLKTILKKNWSYFSDALGDLKTIEVFLSEIERLRNPEAHRRELMPHQKHLVFGISGEIRNRLIRYRSKQDTEDDYYPWIESISDSLGNSWSFNCETGLHVFTKMKLRPGDILDFVISARDPLGEKLQYRMGFEEKAWQDLPEFRYEVTEKDVGGGLYLPFYLRSHRKYHAMKDYDHIVAFHYSVLPPKSI